VGENGAGKTTLVKLLARLYDPDEGRILLDGVDLREYDLEVLRANIGVIFQDFVRYHLTAAENIAVGQIEARDDRARIVEAARRALADEVIEKLPKGYDQVIGKRFRNGVDLSGGEWQKVAIARAYMRDAQLLILDEPTAALDARSEFEVFQRFKELSGARPRADLAPLLQRAHGRPHPGAARGQDRGAGQPRGTAGAARSLRGVVRTAGGRLSLVHEAALASASPRLSHRPSLPRPCPRGRRAAALRARGLAAWNAARSGLQRRRRGRHRDEYRNDDERWLLVGVGEGKGLTRSAWASWTPIRSATARWSRRRACC
jgi:ABC-type lipoprotein export system ATPase subunit